MASNGGRSGARYRRLAAEVREQEELCYFCHQYVPKYLRSPDPASFTVHHKVPVGRGGDLLDRANAAAAHRRCNELSYPAFGLTVYGELMMIEGRTPTPWLPAATSEPAPRERVGWYCDDPGPEYRRCPTEDDGPHSGIGFKRRADGTFIGLHWEGPPGQSHAG
jgi:hypothetical protein